jgi:hypothetical protein
MADDKNTPDPATGDDKDKSNDDQLGEGGKKALEEERRARRAAEKEKKDLEAKLKELEDKDKSEVEKLADKSKTAEGRAATAEAEVLRLKVALRKGLTETQAKRLVGSNEEELEKDAEELLESFKPADGDDRRTPPPGKPKEDLKGGGDPTDTPTEMDPEKLAGVVPRG